MPKKDIKASLRSLDRPAAAPAATAAGTAASARLSRAAAPSPRSSKAKQPPAPAPDADQAGEAADTVAETATGEPEAEKVAHGAKTAKSVTTAELNEKGLARTGYYLRDDVLDAAKSAYLIDFDAVDNSPGNFALWVGSVVEAHAALSTDRRKKLADALPELTPLERLKPGESRKAGTRSFVFAIDIPKRMDAAIADDRQEKHRTNSRSEFVTEALRLAARASAARIGVDVDDLPPAPKRLPNDPARG